MTKVEEPGPSEETEPDLAAAAAAETDVTATLEVEAQTLRDYARVVWVRIRSGESGVLPVVGGLLVISALFQSLNSNFLSAGNLVNLLIQGAVYMLLAMGEVFALLLGEIDLSIGFVGGIGGTITAELVKQGWGWPWGGAGIVALVGFAAIGGLAGPL